MKQRLSHWDPRQDLSDFQNRLATMFGSESVGLGSTEEVDWQPALDVVEDENGFTITVDLPDVKREDAKVTVRDGMLMISGERNRESTDDDKETRYHRVERVYGKYTRSFRLPDTVDPASIAAEFREGVLTVKMPKGSQAEPEEIHIDVN